MAQKLNKKVCQLLFHALVATLPKLGPPWLCLIWALILAMHMVEGVILHLTFK
jgi:hypothetical protein